MQVSHYLSLSAQQFLFDAREKSEKKAKPIDFDVWRHAGEAVVGYRHRVNQQECQDACLSQNLTRPLLVLSDGAGSAAVSDLGAQALSIGLSRLLVSIEPLLAQWLDDPEFDLTLVDEALSNIISRHAKGLLKDLAIQHTRAMNDFSATLLLCIIGRYNTYWCQVGDGYLLKRVSDGFDNTWQLISPPEKGEYANHTCFVDEKLTLSQFQRGLMPSHELTAVAAMSDGAGERLVCQRTGKVGEKMEWIFDEVRTNPTVAKSLLGFLSDPNIWNSTTGDDKSLVILAQ
ncbi:PP2C family serine/threonine-protein phosphatase [Photobacterium leiognathi]|uniref:PP2C family serine/threonine-protein phosphatase n=1 Tax=Photobacterium leiognathi TaxID=553611 RepID=UPI002980F4FD|nr:PP2C family serine/threonine-protein phosphatase [Photobacterium leiognathi]